MFLRKLARFISRFDGARSARFLGFIQALALLVILYPEPAKADDFQRDMTRLQDGLRTDGFAQTIAAIASTIVVILVNGAEIGRTLIQTPLKEGEKGEEKQLVLQVLTRDKNGGKSTTLDTMTGDPIFIQACVYDAVKGAVDGGATAGITFALTKGAMAVSLQEMPPEGDWRVASATAPKPTTQEAVAVDEAIVSVGTTIQGTLITAPVSLSIMQEFEIEFV
jgi:hypothetical protein